MSFSLTETAVFVFCALFLIGGFPFETLILFSLASNLLLLRFLFFFFRTQLAARDDLHRGEPRRQAQVDP
jgi:hypothetical protein